MQAIINATQHTATTDQKTQGVVDLPDAQRVLLSRLLTFDDLPTVADMKSRAEDISKLLCEAALQQGIIRVMIAGAPFFMPTLQSALQSCGFAVLYAFSKRVSEEVENGGIVTKVNVFKHVGFVEAEGR
jgi:hypothetical protein